MQDHVLDELVEIPVEYPLKVVRGQVDPVVRYPGLGEVVGPDLFAPLPCSDLGAAVLGDRLVLLALGDVHQARPQDAERFFLVPVLGFLILARGHHSRRHMSDPDGRVVPVDVLAPGPRCPEGLDLQFLWVELDVDLIGLGEDGHGNRRCMDPPGGLGLGDALDAVDAAFVLERGIDFLAPDVDDHFLEPADGRDACRHDLELPAPLFGEPAVHPEEVLGEERRLVPAGPGPDLQDDVFLVEGVLGQHQDLELARQARLFRPQLLDLALGQRAELGVGAVIG